MRLVALLRKMPSESSSPDIIAVRPPLVYPEQTELLIIFIQVPKSKV